MIRRIAKSIAKSPRMTALMCGILISIIAVAALPISNGGAIARAADVTQLPRANLRAVLSGTPHSDIALVDALTPLAQANAGGILAVDGSFFAAAQGAKKQAVADGIVSQAKAGTSIMVTGQEAFVSLSKTLSSNLGMETSLAYSVDGDVTARVIELFPSEDQSRLLPVVYEISGSRVNDEVVSEGLEWAKGNNGIPEEESLAYAADGVAVRADPDPPDSNSGFTFLSSVVSTTQDWYEPYGKLYVVRTFYQMTNDNDAGHRYMAYKLAETSMPGKAIYSGSDWRNDQLKTKLSVVHFSGYDKPEIQDWGPDSGPDGNSTVGVSIGANAAGPTAALSWSYTTPDTKVYDYSRPDLDPPYAYSVHDVNEYNQPTNSVSNWKVRPGLTAKVDEGTHAFQISEQFTEIYARKGGYFWKRQTCGIWGPAVQCTW